MLEHHLLLITTEALCCFITSNVGAGLTQCRALAFHQCSPGSIPGLGVISGLSLLVLYSAPRGFSPGTPVFPSPQKLTFDLIVKRIRSYT